MNIKKLFNKFSFSVPITIIIYFVGQIILIGLFSSAFYSFYDKFRLVFSGYLLFLIFVSLFAVIYFCYVNIKYFKNFFVKNRYLMIFVFLLLVVLVILLFHDPILVRVDKDFTTIKSADYINIFELSRFNVFFRAKGFFYILKSLFEFLPETIKTVSVINSCLFILQALLFYLSLDLLTNRKVVVFWASLVFLLYPNNFLLALAPDYAFAGQAIGVLSLFALLLYFKFRDKKILYLSLSALVLSVLLRVEMFFWLPIYMFIYCYKQDRVNLNQDKKIINRFLLIIFPLVFTTVLFYFIDPSANNKVYDPAIFSDSGNKVIPELSFFFKNFINHIIPNIKYLIYYVPLCYILLPCFFFLKNKNYQIFILYFFLFLAAISVHFNEYASSYHYLGYLIFPLSILAGLFFADFAKEQNNIKQAAVVVLSILLIGANYFFYNPAWIYSDCSTELWNSEFIFLKKFTDRIDNNSIVISNDKFYLMEIMIDSRKKKIKVEKAKNDLVEQVDSFKRDYKNIYLSQGDLGYLRKEESTFDVDEFKKIIKDNFQYDVIYDSQIDDRRNNCSDDLNVNIFLYKLK